MPARLRPVPDAPPRAVGLVRVSKVGDRGEDLISPDLQRTAIEDHCARRGYVLDRWVEGIDESGSQRRSKWWARLDECVALVEASDADVLVVWRFDRTSRQRLRWAVAIDRVEVAGGLLESATEPLDTSTASGRLARGMLAEMAAYRAEEIGGVWREVHARRTRAGLPANGKPRFGYRYVDGIHRPDPELAPVLAQLYRRYIAGESIYALITWLNAEGVRTVPGYGRGGKGGPWGQTTLRRVLDGGFGAGLLTVRGEQVRGIHEPVIDEATWAAFQAARDRRRQHRRSERATYLLTGLGVLHCAYPLPDGPCGSGMGGGRFGGAQRACYRCNAVTAQQRHSGGYVVMDAVDTAVREWVERLASSDARSADAEALAAARATRRKVDAERLARELGDVEQALVRLVADRARERDVPASVWEAARLELVTQREQVAARLRAARAESVTGEPARVAAQLAADWDEAPLEQLRGGLRELLGRVDVVPGRPRGEVRIIGRWELG